MIRGRSTIGYILEALIPYSDANLKLVYRPHFFFSDLEKISSYKKQTLQNSFYRLKKQGLIEFEGTTPRLTEKGRAQLQLYKPRYLKGGYLMIIFDIPEELRGKRNRLRVLLRELKFTQVQKSVWMTQYECRDYLKAELEDLDIQEHVKLFETYQLNV